MHTTVLLQTVQAPCGGLRDTSKFVSLCCCLTSTGVERDYPVGDCTSAANSSITFQCGLYCSSSEPLACCLIRNMRTLVCCNISCFFIAKSSLGSNHSNTLGVCSGLIGVSLFKMLHCIIPIGYAMAMPT